MIRRYFWGIAGLLGGLFIGTSAVFVICQSDPYVAFTEPVSRWWLLWLIPDCFLLVFWAMAVTGNLQE